MIHARRTPPESSHSRRPSVEARQSWSAHARANETSRHDHEAARNNRDPRDAVIYARHRQRDRSHPRRPSVEPRQSWSAHARANETPRHDHEVARNDRDPRDALILARRTPPENSHSRRPSVEARQSWSAHARANETSRPDHELARNDQHPRDVPIHACHRQCENSHSRPPSVEARQSWSAHAGTNAPPRHDHEVARYDRNSRA